MVCPNVVSRVTRWVPQEASGSTFGELGMMAHPVAVAADVDNVAVMEQPVTGETRRNGEIWRLGRSPLPRRRRRVRRRNASFHIVSRRFELPADTKRSTAISSARARACQKIVGHLHPQPSLGRRAEGLRQPDRRLDRDPRSPVHRLRERLPGAAQPLGGPGHRQVGELIGTPLAPR